MPHYLFTALTFTSVCAGLGTLFLRLLQQPRSIGWYAQASVILILEWVRWFLLLACPL